MPQDRLEAGARDALAPRADAELWIVPGGQHTFAYGAQEDAYETRVTEFLWRSLL